MSSYKTLERMKERVVRLTAEFTECLDVFDNAKLFTGPSLYFHLKTLAIRSKHPTAIQTLNDDDFFESLYATLAAWGMHRMGRGNTKLAELDEIKSSFRRQTEQIRMIETFTITNLLDLGAEQVMVQLWQIITGLKVGIGTTKIVANSKALHHLLPSLVPPIDREYTLRFFYNRKTLTQGDEVAFQEIFPYFHAIGAGRKEEIARRIGRGMNTSETKVIDNAIVGFVHRHLKKNRQGDHNDLE